MKAIITKQVQNARNYNVEKEIVNAWSVIGIKDGKPHEFVSCRCYMGRSRSASVVYASVWVHGVNNLYTSGRGSAGGGGYHKESAAVGEAITSAGIELWGNQYAHEGRQYNHETNQHEPEDLTRQADISGVGSIAITEALKAIAIAAGAGSGVEVFNH